MTTLRLNTPIDDAEVQMRRALQVSTPGASTREPGAEPRGTRRFAQNADVPVTRLTGRKEHSNALAVTIAEDALQAERTAREQTEAALTQANATIVMLQTKLAHAEMAHSEALGVRTHATGGVGSQRGHAAGADQGVHPRNAAEANPGRDA